MLGGVRPSVKALEAAREMVMKADRTAGPSHKA